MLDRREHKIGFRAAMLLGIILAGTPRDIHAEPLDWTTAISAETATNVLYFSDGSSSTTLQSLSVAAGLDLTSSQSRWSGGLFADYHISPDADIDGMVNAGAYIKYRFGRWDTASFVARSLPPGTPGAWLYGTGLRYHLVDGHKLGLHAAAAAGAPESATLVMKYSGYLGHGWSLSLSYGAGLATSRHRVAGLQLAWEAF